MTIAEIIKNKDTLKAQKMGQLKKADGVSFTLDIPDNVTVKAVNGDADTLQVKAAINTTNVLDSHMDVHIPGLWSKSLKENKNIMHIQEHAMSFDKIIADGKDLKATAETMTFKELGFNLKGDTQVLLFNSTVKRDRNTFMFKQYADEHVNNHSVGMMYVKLFLAVNDDKYEDEYKIWQKYYDQIANKADADSNGYFWAVTEAKVIEGSAVPIGSNQVTPTINVTEPDKSTPKSIQEPVKATPKTNLLLSLIS